MDCSLPFVMLPNKSAVEMCSKGNFYIVFFIITFITIAVVISLVSKLRTKKQAKGETLTLTDYSSYVIGGVIFLCVVWIVLGYLIVSGSVSSWQMYQAQANELMKSQGMTKAQALQAIQNQVNTQNIESTVMLNEPYSDVVIY